MYRSIFAITANRDSCLDTLRQAGFRSDEISLLAADNAGINTATEAETEPSPADDSDGGETTAAKVGWLPVVGAVLACGPLALLLRGGVGIMHDLSKLGVPAYAAMRYEEAISRGNVVVAVHTANGFEVETVAELLREGGCEQVAAA